MSLPEAKRPAVARALQSAFGTTVLDALTPLSGGLSGAGVYRIRVGGIAYLLRIEGQADRIRDPARWYGCMRMAADAVIAPRVRYACAADGVAITDFIAARSLTLDYVGAKTALITDLAQTVRALHATPAFPPLMDYLDAMEGLVGDLRASDLLRADVLAEPLARYAELAAVYRRLAPDPVSSHNDLNPRNILYDGRRLWLIDWESAFQADRYVDLAALANIFTVDAAEAETLLRVYFGGAPSLAQRARLFLARQVNHVFYAAVFLNGAAAERPGVRASDVQAPPLARIHAELATGDFVLDNWDGRVTYGRARLTAALENIESPSFAQALLAAA